MNMFEERKLIDLDIKWFNTCCMCCAKCISYGTDECEECCTVNDVECNNCRLYKGDVL